MQILKKPFLPSLIIISIFIIIPILFASAVSAESDKPPYLGDVNDRGDITVADAIMVLRHIVNLQPLEGDLRQRADVNLDGEITVTDAILLLRHIVGLTPQFPVNDPAYVSTERALRYAAGKTAAETINITANMELTEELVINRDIIISGTGALNGNGGETKNAVTITGNLSIAVGAENFTAANLILNGTLSLDTGGATAVHLMQNCHIYRAFFFSGEVTVTGGKNIGTAWISSYAAVVFDEAPQHIKDLIDIEQSAVKIPETVPAGEENIQIIITLKDFTGSPVSGKFATRVVFQNREINQRPVYCPGGIASITLTGTEAGSHTGTVEVENILLETFTVEVQPAEAGKLAVTREPSGSSDGSGNTGEVIIVTQDKWGNDSAKGVGETLNIFAAPNEDDFTKFTKFTGDSETQKNMGTDGGNGKVRFSNLKIETGESLLGQTMVFYSIDRAFEVTSAPFNVTGFAGIDGEESGIVSYPEGGVTAGKDNIRLELALFDSGGNPLSGSFHTIVQTKTTADDECDVWFEGEVTFESGRIRQPVRDGETYTHKLAVTQKTAGDYSDVVIIVDGTVTGTFPVSVKPAKAEIIKPARAEDVIIASAKRPMHITVSVHDIYDNPVQGAEVFVFCFEKTGGTGEPPQRSFDGGTLSVESDDYGKAVFDDLIISDTGKFQIVFDFYETFDFEQPPALKQTCMILPHPGESSVYWENYDAPLQTEFGRPVYAMVFPLDADGEKISGLEPADFTATARQAGTGDPSDPLRGTFTVTDHFKELYPGIYEMGFSYSEEGADPLEIEITVSFRGAPLKREIPVQLNYR